MKYFFILLFLSDVSLASAIRCQGLFTNKEIGTTTTSRWSFLFRPSESYRKLVITLVENESIIRNSATPQNPSKRLRYSFALAKTAVVNFGLYQIVGFIGYLPNFVEIAVSKLPDRQLETLHRKGRNLSLSEIEQVFKPYLRGVTVLGSVVTWITSGIMIFTFVTNTEVIKNVAVGTYDILYSKFAPPQKLMDAQGDEAYVRQKAFERWKEGFKAEVGRYPDPTRFPEDQAEWDFQWQLSQSAPLSNLVVHY